MDQEKSLIQGQIHVGDFLDTPTNCGMVHYVRPVYPKEAKLAHIEGVVTFNVVILKTGEMGEFHLHCLSLRMTVALQETLSAEMGSASWTRRDFQPKQNPNCT